MTAGKYLGRVSSPYGAGNEDIVNERVGVSVYKTRSVSDINAQGVLNIRPSDGRFIRLTGHGNSNIVITGFGSFCPIGYEFSLLVPRTRALTGGSSNALNNFVQFTHNTSSAKSGLDMSINRSNNQGNFSNSYRAYPDANDRQGNAFALYEELKFMFVGEQQWRCVKLPEPVVTTTSTGVAVRYANGVQEAWRTGTPVPFVNSSGNWFANWQYPARFNQSPKVNAGVNDINTSAISAPAQVLSRNIGVDSAQFVTYPVEVPTNAGGSGGGSKTISLGSSADLVGTGTASVNTVNGEATITANFGFTTGTFSRSLSATAPITNGTATLRIKKGSTVLETRTVTVTFSQQGNGAPDEVYDITVPSTSFSATDDNSGEGLFTSQTYTAEMTFSNPNVEGNGTLFATVGISILETRTNSLTFNPDDLINVIPDAIGIWKPFAGGS